MSAVLQAASTHGSGIHLPASSQHIAGLLYGLMCGFLSGVAAECSCQATEETITNPPVVGSGGPKAPQERKQRETLPAPRQMYC